MSQYNSFLETLKSIQNSFRALNERDRYIQSVYTEQLENSLYIEKTSCELGNVNDMLGYIEKLFHIFSDMYGYLYRELRKNPPMNPKKFQIYPFENSLFNESWCSDIRNPTRNKYWVTYFIGILSEFSDKIDGKILAEYRGDFTHWHDVRATFKKDDGVAKLMISHPKTGHGIDIINTLKICRKSLPTYIRIFKHLCEKILSSSTDNTCLLAIMDNGRFYPVECHYVFDTGIDDNEHTWSLIDRQLSKLDEYLLLLEKFSDLAHVDKVNPIKLSITDLERFKLPIEQLQQPFINEKKHLFIPRQCHRFLPFDENHPCFIKINQMYPVDIFTQFPKKNCCSEIEHIHNYDINLCQLISNNDNFRNDVIVIKELIETSPDNFSMLNNYLSHCKHDSNIIPIIDWYLNTLKKPPANVIQSLLSNYMYRVYDKFIDFDDQEIEKLLTIQSKDITNGNFTYILDNFAQNFKIHFIGQIKPDQQIAMWQNIFEHRLHNQLSTFDIPNFCCLFELGKMKLIQKHKDQIMELLNKLQSYGHIYDVIVSSNQLKKHEKKTLVTMFPKLDKFSDYRITQ